jgi:hypothetical protein
VSSLASFSFIDYFESAAVRVFLLHDNPLVFASGETREAAGFSVDDWIC